MYVRVHTRGCGEAPHILRLSLAHWVRRISDKEVVAISAAT